jgi:hypothetical protein
MAAQLYSETQIAECLYEVLSELVQEGTIEEPLAVATLNQVGRSRARRRAWRPAKAVAAVGGSRAATGRPAVSASHPPPSPLRPSTPASPCFPGCS